MKLIVLAVSIAISSTAVAQGIPPAQPPLSLNMQLVCEGGGTASKATAATGFGWGRYSGGATIIGRQDRAFEDQINIRLHDKAAEVRMPRTMLPGLHGGSDGWFEVQGLEITTEAITGEIGVNFANHPKLYVDRITGQATISGKSGDFTGQCKKYDPATTPRAF